MALLVRSAKKFTLLTAAAVLTAGLTACGTDSDPQKAGSGDQDEPLVVAASPTPHAKILEFVRKNLADDAGLKLKIQEFTDYVQPNTATEDGRVGANFFQHKPYLDDFNKKKGTHIVPVVNVELEPLGLYSNKVESTKDLTSGKTIALPNDTTNEGRALLLLERAGLIRLKPGTGASGSLSDVQDRKGLKFKELEAAALPRSLDDVDASVINGNYALEAKLNPSKDALAVEKAEKNPYANFLAVKRGQEKDPRVVKLARLLNSPEVRKYINDTFKGGIVPVFGKVS
ncbi:MetQ/NlpA family ABC transporter substrate-binding protein [Streptomyces sp. NPDC005438]|uniref:MetQ/NlpA family ABC transporter substrate-binding protein n=1 Tax=Streptomyces sp. NPDC005438 TaxID=3156880 RepID=UPI00339E5204